MNVVESYFPGINGTDDGGGVPVMQGMGGGIKKETQHAVGELPMAIDEL